MAWTYTGRAPTWLVASFVLTGASTCGPPGGEGASTTAASTSEAGGSSTAAESGPGHTPEPPACGPAESCECGELGCACGPDGSCAEGTCNPNTGTCTLEQDGMMRVPAGPFWMGCREGVDTDELSGPCIKSQLPYRQVTLDAFWIDRLEVTKGEYRACIDASVCVPPPQWDAEWYQGEGVFVPGRDDMPAASVTWTQAKIYCEWAGKRLPTDAEWEKAARGTDGRKYPWGSAEPTCEHANHMPWDFAGMKPGPPCPYREVYKNLTPVGMFCRRGASVYGACELVGNVGEWAADGYNFDGNADLPAENPFREPTDNLVVRRSAGWGAFALSGGGYGLRASQRHAGGVNDAFETLDQGFRCARSD